MDSNVCDFLCPYCGESMSVSLDVISGSRQELITDCEVCCRPIHITAVIQDGGVTEFNAKTEEEI